MTDPTVDAIATAGSDQVTTMIRNLSTADRLAFLNLSLQGANRATFAILTEQVDAVAQARVLGLIIGYAGVAVNYMGQDEGGDPDTPAARAVIEAIFELDQRVRRAMQ